MTDRAQFNDDGTLDEVVIGSWLHIEEMHRTKRRRDWHVRIGDAVLAVRATTKSCHVTVVEPGWSEQR